MGTEHRRYPDAESSQKPIAHEPAVAEAVAEAIAKAVAEQSPKQSPGLMIVVWLTNLQSPKQSQRFTSWANTDAREEEDMGGKNIEK